MVLAAFDGQIFHVIADCLEKRYFIHHHEIYVQTSYAGHGFVLFLFRLIIDLFSRFQCYLTYTNLEVHFPGKSEFLRKCNYSSFAIRAHYFPNYLILLGQQYFS